MPVSNTQIFVASEFGGSGETCSGFISKNFSGFSVTISGDCLACQMESTPWIPSLLFGVLKEL